MRFRTKTILGVAAIELTLLAVLVGSALSILRDSNEAELVRRVQLGGRMLAAAAKDAVLAEDLATLDSLVDEAMASGQIDFVRIVKAGGVTLSERGDAALLQREFAADASLAEVGDEVFDWAAPIEAGAIRYGEVRLGVSVAPLASLLNKARQWAAGIATVEILLVALFSWLLGSYLARQLVALRDASVAFGAGDLARRVPVQGNDELAETALAFNRMATQLGESHAALQSENRMRVAVQQDLEIALERIRDHSAQLDAIFDFSPDGFVTFDGGGKVKYANRAFRRLTGLSAAEIRGLDAPGFSARLAAACREAARFPGIDAMPDEEKVGAGGTADDDYPRGLTIEITGTGRIIEVGQCVAAAPTVSRILYFRDITHVTIVERMKNEFLSHAAHELRTPMASIFGYVELMLMQEFSAAERQEFLGTIHRQSQWMIAIINELLDLARIDERRGRDFAYELLDPAEFLRATMSIYEVPAGRTAPQLDLPAPGCRIRADRRRLAQAIGNALANAYKFSPDGSTVEVGLLTRQGEDGRTQVGFRVTDHGIGMTAEEAARVCERFYRADTSGKIPGTGLGMSIAREIIELHGGSIVLDSRPGAGTVVTLWLPAVTDALTEGSSS